MLQLAPFLVSTPEGLPMSNEFYVSSIEALLKSLKEGNFNEEDWKILKRCNSQEYCETYIKRFKGAESEHLIPAIYKISLRYRASKFAALDPFDTECLICVLEYEDVRREFDDPKYLAKRVRMSGRKRGWKLAIENIVLKKGSSKGFDILHKFTRLEASFEFFMLSNSTHFEPKVLDAARARLTDHGFHYKP